MSGVNPQLTVTIGACWLLLTAAALVPAGARAADVEAGPPTDRSVTVYRAPKRGKGQPDLDNLEGFALVSEKHTVSLPAGESRLRFLGVADGIQPESAILTGLPDGVLEKNRDAHVLSPAALVAATVGRPVTLVRTNRKTGVTTRTIGTLRADNEGVVFESTEGIEALRCSGFPETFDFTGTADLAPTPTLSVKVRTVRPLTAQVTLSYLAGGFDWSATYAAALSKNARTLDLGAWVTLANSNGVSFPDAHVAVVAGRLNRESPDVEPGETQEEILAQCWPVRATSDIPEVPPPPRPAMLTVQAQRLMAMPAPPPAADRMFKRAVVQEEQLGDLKLYRVPERSSVFSRQMKQVRLLDRGPVPVTLLYIAHLSAINEQEQEAATRVLRTRNDTAHHLGIALPAGRISTFTQDGETPLLLAEADQRDIAVGEDFEIDAGEAADVQVRSVRERTLAPAAVAQIPLLPGIDVRTAYLKEEFRIEITNARRTAVSFEARLSLPYGTQLLRASVPPFLRDGWQVMRVQVPAGVTVTVRYQTGHRVSRAVRPR
jgi:hypothetical protein